MPDQDKSREELEKELARLRVELAERKLFDTQQDWTLSRVRQERKQLYTTVSCLPHGLCIISGDCRVRFENRWVRDRFGRAEEKICHEAFFGRKSPCPGCVTARAIEKNTPCEIEVSGPQGRIYKLIASPVGSFEGRPSAVEILIDVTEHKRVQEDVFRAQQKYVDLVNNLRVGVYRGTPGPEGHFLEVNPALISMLGAKSKTELLRRNINEFYAVPAKRAEVSAKLMKFGFVKGEEIEFLSAKGRRFWVAITAVKGRALDGSVYFDGIIEDIDRQKKTAEAVRRLNATLRRSNRELGQLALRDSHTGLYNHRYLQDIIEVEISRAQRYAYPLAVVMFDLDKFKSINDRYGHQAGDAVLKQLARRVEKVVHRSDTVIRFGGDEFVLILPQTDSTMAMIVVRRLLDAIRKTRFRMGGRRLKITISAAVTAYPEYRPAKGMGLVRLADRLLVRVKKDGGNRAYASVETKKGEPVVSEKEVIRRK